MALKPEVADWQDERHTDAEAADCDQEVKAVTDSQSPGTVILPKKVGAKFRGIQERRRRNTQWLPSGIASG